MSKKSPGKGRQPVARFEKALSRRELRQLQSLSSPARIQAFLDSIPYKVGDSYDAPLQVLRTRTAHCFDGALLAAAALRRLGQPPLILYMTAVNDDGHLIALYRNHGCYGAVAKSNFVGLRFREPIYRTLRELVLSYFEAYFNLDAEKTLRTYTRPLNLAGFDRVNWMTENAGLELISERLDRFQQIPLLTRAMIQNLEPVDRRLYKANMLGVNLAGAYQGHRR
jgi:hypothetical protein